MTGNQTVWKYPLPLEPGEFTLEMPFGAQIIHVAEQGSHVCASRPQLWAIVDPDAEQTVRNFLLVGTGDPIPTDRIVQHVGTWQVGRYVWHLFQWFNSL